MKTTILYNQGDRLVFYRVSLNCEQYTRQWTSTNDRSYGAGSWTVLPTASLPSDFSVDTYMIVDGELVQLSAEVIAEREAATLRASDQAGVVAEIARLKEHLAATDWAVVKCLEIGAPLAEIYPHMAAERIEARARINELQKGGIPNFIRTKGWESLLNCF